MDRDDSRMVVELDVDLFDDDHEDRRFQVRQEKVRLQKLRKKNRSKHAEDY